MIYRLICILSLLSLSAELFPQQVMNLPDDPRIYRGEVENGFKYYIIENDLRQGYADFYLVRRVGFVNEKVDQVGFNTIIGEMGLEGTRNFPNNTIVSYFDQMGLDQFSDFRMLNGQESSLHRLENIPVSRGNGVIDSTLLVLYNWSFGINLDEEEVEMGKKYYQNALTSKIGENIFGKIAHLEKIMVKDSCLMEFNPDVEAVIKGVDKYKAKDIRSFYYRWFAPDRLALVVVGDISKDVIEPKVRKLFQSLPMFIDSVEEDIPEFATHEDPLVSVFTAPEATSGLLSIYFTVPPLPHHLRGSAVPYIEEYMSSMMTRILNERLVMASQYLDIAFFPKDISYGQFMESSSANALKLDISTAVQDVEKTLETVMEILYDIKGEGFGQEEFERARRLYFEELYYDYDWRIFTPNSTYARRAMDHYLGGYTLASVEMKREYMDKVKESINLDQFNMFASSYFRGGDNCIVTFTGPENPNIVKVSQHELEERAKKIIRRQYVENVVRDMEYAPFEYEYKSSGGKIVSEYTETNTKAKVWTLSNGATVVFKRSQAQPNRFMFEAVSKGGLTLLGGGSAIREYIDDIASLSAVGRISSPVLHLYKSDADISLDKNFSLSATTLQGGAPSKSLERFMKVVNLHFTPAHVDEDVFSKYRKTKREELISRKYSPAKVFEDTLSTYLYHKSRYVTSQSVESFENLDYGEAIRFINDRFSNAAGFTFIFTGDIDEKILKDLVIKYIAPIRGDHADKDVWMNIPIYLKKTPQRKVMEMDMSLPREYFNMTLISPSQTSPQGIVNMQLASEIIRKRVVRQMKAHGFPVEIDTRVINYPENFFLHSISSVVRESSEELEKTLLEVLGDLQVYGATEMEVSNARSVLTESYRRGERESLEFWIDILRNRFIYGNDFYLKYPDYVESSTIGQVNSSLKRYLDDAINTVLILKGTSDDKHNSD